MSTTTNLTINPDTATYVGLGSHTSPEQFLYEYMGGTLLEGASFEHGADEAVAAYLDALADYLLDQDFFLIEGQTGNWLVLESTEDDDEFMVSEAFNEAVQKFDDEHPALARAASK